VCNKSAKDKNMPDGYCIFKGGVLLFIDSSITIFNLCYSIRKKRLDLLLLLDYDRTHKERM
jgi:hypothetical protein